MLSHICAKSYPENIKSLTLFGYPVRAGYLYPKEMIES
jgi:hypothetical protein